MKQTKYKGIKTKTGALSKSAGFPGKDHITECNGDFIKNSLERQKPITGDTSGDVVWSTFGAAEEAFDNQIDKA